MLEADQAELPAPPSCFCAPAELEYRIQAQLLPLLLHLDQAALTFLQHFFAPEPGPDSSAAGSSRSSSRQQEEVASEQPAQPQGDLVVGACWQCVQGAWAQ